MNSPIFHLTVLKELDFDVEKWCQWRQLRSKWAQVKRQEPSLREATVEPKHQAAGTVCHCLITKASLLAGVCFPLGMYWGQSF